MLFFKGDWGWDIETYPNICTFAFQSAETGEKKLFEISSRANDLEGLLQFCRDSIKYDYRWVGFNNLGFDYVVIHWILDEAVQARKEGKKLSLTPNAIYKYAMKVIDSKKGGGYGINVRANKIRIRQLDLFKMNHYDNKAKMTSLKLLEFNMRLKNIEDLPFEVGKRLSQEEMQILCDYNFNDVYATLEFYKLCHDAIAFRQDLSSKYGFDCTNLNDSKIGEQFFIKRIESEDPEAFYVTDDHGKRHMKQTPRDKIYIKDCLFDYIGFKRPEFQAVHKWFKQKVIIETKGALSDIEEHDLGDVAKYAEMITISKKFKVKPNDIEVADFKKLHPLGWIEERELKALENLLDKDGNVVQEIVINAKGKAVAKNVKVPKKSYYGCYRVAENLNVVIDGFRYDFGTGGIHGSIQGTVEADDNWEVIDWDVKSYYPNMAIANRIYPEHLSEKFCDSYEAFYIERGKFAKGTGENLAIKLGLNATYGNSNSEFSPFYDPKYTMSITIGGQLSLCMLVEKLLELCEVKVIQCNTDGATFKVRKDKVELMNQIIKRWENVTGLEMEDSHYSSMYIRDVNNYIAIYTNGKMKQKGQYEYKPQKGFDLTHMHKNHSALVIQMAVENYIINGINVEEYIKNHENEYDFMLRAKVPRSCKLVLVQDGVEIPQQNICRYYPSVHGGNLVKIMPPLEGKEEDREMAIESSYLVRTCNDISKFDWDINYDYYITEVNKLLEPFEQKIYDFKEV